MKDKEIAKIICKECLTHKKDCIGGKANLPCLMAEFCGEALYNAGYRKIPENAFILTDDNAEELGDIIVKSPQMKSVMSELIEAWQKETAEEIWKFVLNMSYFDLDGQLIFPISSLKNYIVKQVGVEIKE